MLSIYKKAIAATLGLMCASLLTPQAGHAGIVSIQPDIKVEVGIVGDTRVLSPQAEPNGQVDQFDLNGQMTMPDMWNFNWDMTVDTDPFINGVFGLTNISGVTQTFILNVTLPIAPAVTPSSVIGGSVGGSVTDSNNDGTATVATSAPSPLFEGLIDGAGVLSILSDPFSVSAPFAGGTANIPATNVGLPGPTIPGPAAFSTIAINHTFTLTPGDSVSLSSFFIVEVPEPASLAIFGLGAALIGFKRR